MTTSMQLHLSRINKSLFYVIMITTLPLLVDSVSTKPETRKMVDTLEDRGVFCRNNLGQDIPAKSFILSSCHTCLTSITRLPFENVSLNRHDKELLQVLCKFGDNPSSCLTQVTDCCKAAEDCCLAQSQSLSKYQSRSNDFCPATWDSLSCIEMTPKNSVVKVPCPKYIWPDLHDVYGTKKCLPDATWQTENEGNLTWENTDYLSCLNTKKIEMNTMIKLVLNCISLFFIFASLCIFLGIRPLRKERRIQMHVNLFAALFMQIIFDIFICAADLQQYRVIDGGGETIYDKIKFCQFIGIGNRFFHSATYTWYVCEAIFLYRLLDRAFEQMRSIKFFYLGGWGTPFVINIIYCIVRSQTASDIRVNKSIERCWLNDLGPLEWVHRGPIFLELIMNTCFLIFILHTVYNLQNQGNSSSSNYRRSVRAALLLAPLFGLNSVLIAFHREDTVYNIFESIVAGSQGALVAIIFCFLNGEVRSAVRLLVLRSEIPVPFLNRGSSSQNGSFQYASGSRSNSGTRYNCRYSAATEESRHSESNITTTPDRQRTHLTVKSPSHFGRSSV